MAATATMQPTVATSALREISEYINWTASFYAECSGETILTPDQIIYASPGDFGTQGRVLLTTYQLLYKPPGTLGVNMPPESFPVLGLASIELQPELYGFVCVTLVGVHHKRLSLYFGSRMMAMDIVAKIQALATSMELTSCPAFKSPSLVSRYPWSPSEINVRTLLTVFIEFFSATESKPS